MNSLPELYKDLDKYSNFKIENNTQLFLDTVGEILKHKDSSSISILLSYFDDKTDYGFVMQGMIAGMESYPDEVYVKAILHEIKKGIEKYPEWLTTITYKILNHNACFQIFKSNMNLAEKDSLLELFDIIEQESPGHKNLIFELQQELKSQQ